jgi:hypothetical protein
MTRRQLHSSRYAGRVFENELVELDAAATLAAAEANEHALITAETRRLQIATHWADLHHGDAIANCRIRGAEHAVRLGGDGTPTVRLRLTCAAALSGQVPGYQARYLASATRHLSLESWSWAAARNTG